MSELETAAEDAGDRAAGPVGGLDVRIARELIERARAEGVSLVGEGGLLQEVTRSVLQTALEAEMAEHLGYERGQSPPVGVGNRGGQPAQWELAEDGAHRGR